MTTNTATRERPIPFTGPEVRAILEGRKTQTRRVVKPQPTYDEARGMWRWETPRAVAGWSGDRPQAAALLGFRDECPYGAPGDTLWVRETWCLEAHPITSKTTGRFLYRATDPCDFIDDGDGYAVLNKDGTTRSPWRPSIHMPRVASRLTLRVTSVRVERLQEISEEDARAEGVGPLRGDGRMANGLPALDGFADLWDSLNAKRAPWSSNPWVFVVSFERVCG